MERRHTAALHQQWEDFEQLCSAARSPLSRLKITCRIVFGDLKATETTVGAEVAKQLMEIREFQCPLCRAKVGAECFASCLSQCPQCRFPYIMLM